MERASYAGAIPEKQLYAQVSVVHEQKKPGNYSIHTQADGATDVLHVTAREKPKKIDTEIKDFRVAKEPKEGDGLDVYVDYFDRAWHREGLPADWYNLKRKVGFSMRSQMDLLKDTSPSAVDAWLQQTEQDVRGFSLEYLSQHLVYPCTYKIDAADPTRLVDPKYGNKDMVEVVSDKERNGSVRDALQKMKAHFLSGETREGAIAVMASPKGESGLATDDGKAITYPDSYFFIMQKQHGEVTNFTVKTDYSHHECREVIYRLTGKHLSPTASVEEYVRAVAGLAPDTTARMTSIEEVVRVLEDVRLEKGNTKAFDKTSWSEVYKDIEQAEQLYAFSDAATDMLEAFRQYCKTGQKTKEQLQKGLAATLLRISKLLLHDEQDSFISGPVSMERSTWYAPMPRPRAARSYGEILDQVASIPGCAGGGGVIKSSMYVQSVVPRVAFVGEDQFGSLKFKCPSCHRTNKRKPGKLLSQCEHCDSTEVACES